MSRSIVRSCFNTLDSFNLTTLKTRLALLSLFIIDRNQQEIELTNALKAVANDYNINNGNIILFNFLWNINLKLKFRTTSKHIYFSLQERIG